MTRHVGRTAKDRPLREGAQSGNVSLELKEKCMIVTVAYADHYEAMQAFDLLNAGFAEAEGPVDFEMNIRPVKSKEPR